MSKAIEQGEDKVSLNKPATTSPNRFKDKILLLNIIKNDKIEPVVLRNIRSMKTFQEPYQDARSYVVVETYDGYTYATPWHNVHSYAMFPQESVDGPTEETEEIPEVLN